MSMKWTGAVIAALTVAALSACSSGKPAGCVTLSPNVAQAVVDGAKSEAIRIKGSTGRAVQAESGIYYAAWRITVDGHEETGVWALGSIDPPGPIRSVDAFAEGYTNWPVLPGANGSEKARDAEACLD